MILDHQLLGRLPQVPKEPLRHFQAVHHPPRDGRQIAHRVIASTAAELLAECRRPVLRAHLPTVYVQHRPAGVGRRLARPDLAQQRADERIEMHIQRGLVELIAFQPQAGQRCGPRAGTVARAAKSHNGPLPLRHLPGEATTRIQLGCEVHHAVCRHHRLRRQDRIADQRWQPRLHARLRRIRCPHIQRLLVYVANALVARRRRESQHQHIAIEVILRLLQLLRQRTVAEERRSPLRTRQGLVEVFRPGDLDRARHQVLHGLLRLDPRPAAARPPWPGVERDLQAQPLRLADRVLEQRPPLGAHELHRPARDADIHLHHDHTANPSLLQRLKIRRDPLPSQVAVHDEPIHPRPRRFRRLTKALFQVSPPPRRLASRGQSKNQQNEVDIPERMTDRVVRNCAIHAGLRHCCGIGSCGDPESGSRSLVAQASRLCSTVAPLRQPQAAPPATPQEAKKHPIPMEYLWKSYGDPMESLWNIMGATR